MNQPNKSHPDKSQPNKGLPEKWGEAYDKSVLSFTKKMITNPTIFKCDSDETCPFIRSMRFGNMIYITCIFNKCVKRYPKIEELEELK